MILTLIILSFLLSPAQGKTAPDAEEVIIEMALESLYESYDKEHFRFKITPRWIPGNIRTLDPEQIEEVVADGVIQKYTNFIVAYKHNRRSFQRAEIQLLIKAEQQVPVTTRRMQSGDIIFADDLILKWVQIDLGRDKPVDSANKLIGKTLRRSLNTGQYISSEYISSRLVVEAGDNINMIYEEGGLQISMGCESRQSGIVGEEIQVYCKETRKKYSAKILKPGETLWLKTH